MKKFLVMAAAAMMVAFSANAQSRFEPGTLTIQPRLGGTGAMLSNAPDFKVKGASRDIDATATGGTFIGADFEYQLTDRFSTAAGVNWAQAGSGWKDTDFSTVKMRDLKIESSYVNVPVTLNCYLFKGFAVKTGVQFSFLTSAKLKATFKSSVDNVNASMEIDEDFKDNFNKFDLSIPIGVSYEFKVPIVIDMRYHIGLNKVNKESVSGEKDTYNQVLSLTVGYKFAL